MGPEFVPAPTVTDGLDLVRDLVERGLDGPAGHFVIEAPRVLDLDEGTRFVIAASEQVGTLLPQDGEGSLVREVKDRGMKLGEGRTGRYSDSRGGGNLHTDGPHHPPPVPDCFALFCVRQARTGGSLCLVPAVAVIADLPDWAVEVLSSDFHFDRRTEGLDEPTVRRPVISGSGPARSVSYLREYIEIGHRQPGVPALTRAQTAALDALDRRLDDPALQSTIRLEPGQLIMINNRTLFHGRTAFEDEADPDAKRLMLRTWIQRAPST